MCAQLSCDLVLLSAPTGIYRTSDITLVARSFFWKLGRAHEAESCASVGGRLNLARFGLRSARFGPNSARCGLTPTTLGSDSGDLDQGRFRPQSCRVRRRLRPTLTQFDQVRAEFCQVEADLTSFDTFQPNFVRCRPMSAQFRLNFGRVRTNPVQC